MKKQICIIGAFDFVNLPTGGQPVKTRELYYALCNEYGSDSIKYIDTYGWRQHPIKLLKKLNQKSKICNCFIMLPAHNGVNVFSRILIHYKRKKNVKIFYDVIGGWLPEKTSQNSRLRKALQNFDGIWVETTSMKEALDSQGLNNISVVPNFKTLSIVKTEEMQYSIEKPLKVCTFSRVTEKKGIEDAIEAVVEINKEKGLKALYLDIYGQIDDEFSDKFAELCRMHSDDITYCGVIEPNKSVSTLVNYFALLFPTHFYTEGIPGTLIDAYFSGVPVITAKWKNARDIFEEDVTGWSYEFGDKQMFKEKLKEATENPSEFLKLKETTLNKAMKYHSTTVIQQIRKIIG